MKASAAKLMWIKGLQNKMFSEENFEIKTADLGIYCNEKGLIRCKKETSKFTTDSQ